MSRKSILIIGASRGLGKQWVREYLEKHTEFDVYATVRKDDTLADLAGEFGQRLVIISNFDVSSESLISDLKNGKFSNILPEFLDLVIYNAGILSFEPNFSEDFSYEHAIKQYNVNALGILRVFEGIERKLRPKKSKILLTGSRMGSFSEYAVPNSVSDTSNIPSNHLGYSMSRSASHMAGLAIANICKKSEIPVAIVHPGLVCTEMAEPFGAELGKDTGEGVWISVEESVEKMNYLFLEVLTMENSGNFWKYDGSKMRW